MEYLNLIKHPKDFFKGIAKENINKTIRKTAIPLFALIIIQSILGSLFFSKVSDKMMSLFNLPVQQQPTMILSVITNIIQVPLVLIIFAYLINLSLKILKAEKLDFEQTLKILIYIEIVVLAFSIITNSIVYFIPDAILQLIVLMIFGLIVAVWDISATAKGLSAKYKITVGKGVGAYFMTLAFVLAAIIIVSIIIGIFTAIFAILFKIPLPK